VLSQRWDDRAMRPIYGCPENFRDSLTMPTAIYLTRNFSWAFVLIHPMNVRTKFKVRSFTRSWDNKGYLKNWGSPWICPRCLSSKFLIDFDLDASYECRLPAKLEAHSFTCSWVNRGYKRGRSLAMPIQRETVGGRGWYRSKERWWVPIGRP